MTTENKLLEVLLALEFEDTFKNFINEEFHIFFSTLQDTVNESDANTPWVVIKNSIVKDHEDIINFAYNLLQDWI